MVAASPSYGVSCYNLIATSPGCAPTAPEMAMDRNSTKAPVPDMLFAGSLLPALRTSNMHHRAREDVLVDSACHARFSDPDRLSYMIVRYGSDTKRDMLLAQRSPRRPDDSVLT